MLEGPGTDITQQVAPSALLRHSHIAGCDPPEQLGSHTGKTRPRFRFQNCPNLQNSSICPADCYQSWSSIPPISPPWLSRSVSPVSGVEISPFTTSLLPTLGALHPSIHAWIERRPLTNLSSTARNSRPLEVIGTYDPIPKTDPYDDSGKLHKDIQLDRARARYWIGVGAQPTDTAWRLLSMLNILPKKEFGPKKDEIKGIVQKDQVQIR